MLAWTFCRQIQLHRELTDLSLKSSHPGFILRDHTRRCLFIIQFAPIDLRQPELNEIGGDTIGALRVSATDDAAPDVLAELQFEGRRVPTVGTS
jgi:hypothetical protein